MSPPEAWAIDTSYNALPAASFNSFRDRPWGPLQSLYTVFFCFFFLHCSSYLLFSQVLPVFSHKCSCGVPEVDIHSPLSRGDLNQSPRQHHDLSSMGTRTRVPGSGARVIPRRHSSSWPGLSTGEGWMSALPLEEADTPHSPLTPGSPQFTEPRKPLGGLSSHSSLHGFPGLLILELSCSPHQEGVPLYLRSLPLQQTVSWSWCLAAVPETLYLRACLHGALSLNIPFFAPLKASHPQFDQSCPPFLTSLHFCV